MELRTVRPPRGKAMVVCLCLLWLASTYQQAWAAEALPPQAELVFEDSFEKPNVDPAWKVRAGEWRVESGALRAQGPDAFVLLDRNA